MPKKIIEEMKSKKSLKSQIPLNIKPVSADESLRAKAPVDTLIELEPKPVAKSTRITLPRVSHMFSNTKIPKINFLKIQKERTGKTLIILGIILALIAAGYWLSIRFGWVTISVTAKHQAFVFKDEVFTASKDTAAPLHFEMMILSDAQSKEMELSESSAVSQKAQGTVTFYNEYSSKSQTLAIHTKIAGVSGKVYLTDKAVTIPGDKTVSGKIFPGSVSVGVTAFGSGPAYNSTETDLSILGFKGTPKYTKIYAKAKTAFEGGMEGLFYSLGAEQKGVLDAFAQSIFKANLIKKLQAQVPTGYLTYNDLMQFSYNVDGDTKSETKTARVNVTGTLSALIVKEADIQSVIIRKKLPNISAKEFSEIYVPNLSSLAFSFANKGQLLSKDTESAGLSLNTTGEYIWNPDLHTLQTALAGAPKETVETIFRTDPGIATATISFIPPWQKYVPETASRIHISKRAD